PRPVTTIAKSPAWLRTSWSPEHRSRSSVEPRLGGRGSRQAKHGCFARESGQGESGWLARHAAHPRERPACCAGPDRAAALTERKAIPDRQDVARVRSPDVALLPPRCIHSPRLRELRKGDLRSTGRYVHSTP